MSSAGDILLAGDAVLLATHSTESVTILGTPYSCFVMDSSNADDLVSGGFSPQDMHRAAIPRAIISLIPSEGDVVTFRSQQLRILSVRRDDAEAPIVLELGSETSSKRS